jgi:hypothetical protein
MPPRAARDTTGGRTLLGSARHRGSFASDQGLETLAYLSDTAGKTSELAARVAPWTIESMEAPDGQFYYRDLAGRKPEPPTYHSEQEYVFRALAHLLSRPQERANGETAFQA